MNRLSCNVRKCNNNSFGMCHRELIVIDGLNVIDKEETRCASFKKHKIFMTRNTNTLKEYLGKLEGVLDERKTPEILCNIVNCRYNMETKCMSNNIMIYGFKARIEGATRCNSFMSQVNN